MFKKMYLLLFVFLPIVFLYFSCDDNDKSYELSNTMWIYPTDIHSDLVYYEFTKNKLYYFEYPAFSPGECITLIYQANFEIKDNSIWIKKYTDWKKLSDYEFRHDTLFLKDIQRISSPEPGLPLVPYHKNDSTWVVCD